MQVIVKYDVDIGSKIAADWGTSEGYWWADGTDEQMFRKS